MASFEYNPIAVQLNLKFSCPNCGSTVEDFVEVPSPDLLAETHHDSINSDSEEIVCEHCGQEITVDTRLSGRPMSPVSRVCPPRPAVMKNGS